MDSTRRVETDAHPGLNPEALHELHAIRTRIKELQARAEDLRSAALEALEYRDGRTRVPGFGSVCVQNRNRSQFDIRRFRAAHPHLWRQFSINVPFSLLRLTPDKDKNAP